MYMSFSGTYIVDKQGKYRSHAHSHSAVVYSHIHLISNRTCQTNLTAPSTLNIQGISSHPWRKGNCLCLPVISASNYTLQLNVHAASYTWKLRALIVQMI